jgi:hypothetical protein
VRGEWDGGEGGRGSVEAQMMAAEVFSRFWWASKKGASSKAGKDESEFYILCKLIN